MISSLLALLLAASPADARIFSVPILVDDEEDLNSLYNDGVLSEEDLNVLLELLNNPVNLNRAKRDDLYDLPGITLELAETIIRHRKAHGAFESEEGLLKVEGVDAYLFEQLAPFVHVRPPLRLKGDVKGRARLRTVKEFKPVEPLTTEGPFKTHSPEQLGYGKWPSTYLTARAEYQKWLEVGFLGLAQEGLSDLTWNPNSHQLTASMGTPVFELGKVFVSASKLRSEVILGSYVAGFGQGLVFDMTSRSHPHGIYPDLTVSGTDHYSARKGLFGLAGHTYDRTLGGGTVEATVFTSSARHDIYQYDVGLTGGLDLDPVLDKDETTSPKVFVDGQKIGWATLPNFYREDIVGANAGWSMDDRRHVGLTGYFGHLDRSIVEGLDEDNQFLLRSGFPNSSTFGAMGLDATFGVGRVDFYLDVAHSFEGGGEFLDRNGYLLTSILDVGLGEVTGSLRRYGTAYANPHARGVAAADEYGGMRDRDEQGARLQAQIQPLGWLATRVFVDYWQNLSTQRENLELFGSGEFRTSKYARLMLFGDYRDRDLSTRGRGYKYGGEWEDPETAGDTDPGYEYTGAPVTDPSEYPTDYLDQRGTKQYFGTQLTVDAIPRTTLSFFYKRIYEDTALYWPTETGCAPWWLIGHYTWVKVRVQPTSKTTISARFRYQDDSIYTTTGDRYHESYLQIDQKLPKRVKVSLRGTLHKDLDDATADWVDPCKDFEHYQPPTDDGGCVVDSTPTTTDSKKPEGLVWASVEWRF
jgi:hypothetical protein